MTYRISVNAALGLFTWPLFSYQSINCPFPFTQHAEVQNKPNNKTPVSDTGDSFLTGNSIRSTTLLLSFLFALFLWSVHWTRLCQHVVAIETITSESLWSETEISDGCRDRFRILLLEKSFSLYWKLFTEIKWICRHNEKYFSLSLDTNLMLFRIIR